MGNERQRPVGAVIVTGVSAAELAAVLASIQTPPNAPTVAPVRVPIDETRPVQVAEGATLTAALGDPTAPNRPRPTEPSPYRCRICGGEMDAFHAAIGTHPTCEPEPAPVAEPPSTVPDLCEALIDWEDNRDRSQQVDIGPSEIGVACDRRLAYSLRMSELPSGRVKWAPMQGTAVHHMLAATLRHANTQLGRQRWLVEEKVWPAPSVYGHNDAYDTDHDLVIDWKLVNPEHIKPNGPRGGAPGRYRADVGAQYRIQAHLYGLGWQRAGRTPRFVRIVFLPRASFIDGAYEWTEPYDRRVAEAALDRLYRTLNLLLDLGVDTDPTLWAAIPATVSEHCKWCPFYRTGGPADATGCPGDVAAQERRDAKFDDGLIVPKTTKE